MEKAQITIAAMAAVFVSSLATAAPLEFDKADANGDGSVNSAELAASGVEKDLKELDENGDGKLSKDEYAAALDEDCE